MSHTGDGAGGTRLDGDGLRLLVVDDNRDAADTLGLLLQLLGHHPTVAYDGAAAVRAAAAEAPDAVLLDLALPGRDGFGVAADLRRADGLGDVPLVALTGYADEELRDRASQCGFDLYLVKPVDELALRAVLAQVAEVRRLARRVSELSAGGRAFAAECRSLLREQRRQLGTMREAAESMGVWAAEAADGGAGR